MAIWQFYLLIAIACGIVAFCEYWVLLGIVTLVKYLIQKHKECNNHD